MAGVKRGRGNLAARELHLPPPSRVVSNSLPLPFRKPPRLGFEPGLELGLEPGVRFSKVPLTFRARNQAFKSKYKEKKIAGPA